LPDALLDLAQANARIRAGVLASRRGRHRQGFVRVAACTPRIALQAASGPRY
jgi:hypothetical protein